MARIVGASASPSSMSEYSVRGGACFSLAYDEGVSRQYSMLASMADRVPEDFEKNER